MVNNFSIRILLLNVNNDSSIWKWVWWKEFRQESHGYLKACLSLCPPLRLPPAPSFPSCPIHPCVTCFASRLLRALRAHPTVSYLLASPLAVPLFLLAEIAPHPLPSKIFLLIPQNLTYMSLPNWSLLWPCCNQVNTHSLLYGCEVSVMQDV